MTRLSSRPQLSINDIRHTKSRFGSIYMALNNLDCRKRRLAFELNRTDMRNKVMTRHLKKVELEIREKTASLLTQ